MQYLYENLNSHEQESMELLESLEGHLRDSGYSESAIDCFIETADIHDVEYQIQLSSLDEGAKTQLVKKLGQGAWNFIKNVGRRSGTTVKRNTPVNVRKNIKDAGQKVKDTVTKGSDAIKDTASNTGKKISTVVKNNPVTSAVAGTTGLVGAAALTSGDGEKEEKKIDVKPKDTDAKKDTVVKPTEQLPFTGTNKYTQDIKLKDPGVITPKTTNQNQTAVVTPPKPEAKKKNVPDGLARGVTGVMDFMTGNITDFDQRGGKPQGFNRALTGFVDATTGNLTDLDKRGGKPFGAARAVTGLADKLTGDRFDFDQRGVSPLNKGQRDQLEKEKQKNQPLPQPQKDDEKKDVKPPIVVDPPKDNKSDEKKVVTPPVPEYTNPSGKKLPTPKEIRKGSNLERMVNKQVEIHGAENVAKLRNSNAAFQATKDRNSGYTMKDFIKDFPNSNAAKDSRKNNRQMHPDLDKALGRNKKESYDPTINEGGSVIGIRKKGGKEELRSTTKLVPQQTQIMSLDDVKAFNSRKKGKQTNESFEPFDIVLSYLGDTGQAESLDEALYIMMEMNETTIQGIVRDYEYLAEEAYDRQKDAQAERGAPGPGDGDNPSTRKPNYGRKQTDAEKKKSQENSKKAFNTVVDRLRSKYGNNAIVTNSHLKKAAKKKEEAKNK